MTRWTLIALVVASVAYGGPKEDAVREATKAARDSGLLIQDYDPGGEGRGLLAKGLIPPKGWEQITMERRFPITTTAKKGDKAPLGVIIPCPQNIVDQADLGSSVTVVAGNATL